MHFLFVHTLECNSWLIWVMLILHYDNKHINLNLYSSMATG